MNFKQLAVAALLVTTATVSNAAVLYDNGPISSDFSNEMSQWIQSEDFVFSSAQVLNSISFNSVDSGLFDGTIVWQIYSDIAGQPGSILFSGTAAPTRTTGATISFGIEHTNAFSVGALSLAAGTYHLGLHNGALTNTTREEFYWEGAVANASQAGLENIAPFGDNAFDSNRDQHVFQLIGGAAVVTVPEPASLALVGLGVLGLALARRRSKSVR